MKKRTLISCALLLFAAANLRVGCRVTVDGTTLPESYSLRQLRECLEAAEAAVEELSGVLRKLPAERELFLTLAVPAGDEKQLTDALILSSGAAEKLDAVYIDGSYGGAVRDGELLRRLTRRELPSTGASGFELRRRYCRPGDCADYGELLAAMSGSVELREA